MREIRNRRSFPAIASLALAALHLAPSTRADILALPENGTTLGLLRDGETHLELTLVGWGPAWKWLGLRGSTEEAEDAAVLSATARVPSSGARVGLSARVRKTGPRRLSVGLEARTDKDTDVTYLIGSLQIPERVFSGGRVIVEPEAGETREVALPLGLGELGTGVRRLTVVDGQGRRSVLSFDPPCRLATDRSVRIVLAADRFPADAPRRVEVTFDLPEDIVFYTSADRLPDEPGIDEWYPFEFDPDHDGPTEIGMEDWLEAPAGRHGRIVREGDRLVYGGRPIRLWGINLCYSACAPEPALARRRARFYARYGINSVRLHKFADGPGWAGIQSPESFTRFDPDGLDRMDAFVAELKKRGIYVKLSAHFGALKIGPADHEIVPYATELGSASGRGSRITTPHSALFYSPELQELQIRQIVTLLRHRNPHTGMTYASDPAVCAVEIVNEQSVLFYTSMAPLKASPTLRASVARRFCRWLRARYRSHDGLLEAWGERALDSFESDGFPKSGEHLDRDNILPLGNPWYWDPEQLDGSQAYRSRRLLDTLEFLYGLQCAAYDRYVKAVRDAGYEGEILGSNWQAGRALSHYYNLHSDYRVGLIDRHNYFGGGDGGKIDDASMLRVPGSGMLSAGMQQVIDRPFMLSEWIHVAPTEWGVEGPAIIGAYGMGLQGWDVSYMFQNRDDGGFRTQIGRDRWEVTTPHVLGVFPAVARQVHRGDVRESTLRATRYVHVPSLAQGRLGFEDRTTQVHDVKTFDSDKVPARALAVARTVVEFTEEYRDTPRFDLSPYREGDTFASSTGQLRWREGGRRRDGHFTVSTPGTRAVVGFAEGVRCELDGVTITPASSFGAIYVTARGPREEIASTESLLVVAIARARNRGMRVLEGTRLLARGGPPVVMEPVRATIRIDRPGRPTVTLLDHNGRRTGKTLPVRDRAFSIDGSRDRTPYYLVTY